MDTLIGINFTYKIEDTIENKKTSELNLKF